MARILHRNFTMNFALLIFQFLLFWNFSFHILKDLPPYRFPKALPLVLTVYFTGAFLLHSNSPLENFILFLLPVMFLFAGWVVLQKQTARSHLLVLYNMVPSLISQMKLGFSFPDAWERIIKDMENKKETLWLQEVLNTLRFQKSFSCSHKYIKELVEYLNQARLSAQPLKKLKQLNEKIKIERLFYRKAARVLMQLRLQSGILGVLYLAVLIWTINSTGLRHKDLILFSFFLFFIGLFWIFKTGRRMKWSL